MSEKKKSRKQSKWQRRFSEGFTGKKIGIKKPADINGQDQSREAKEKRRKAREAASR